MASATAGEKADQIGVELSSRGVSIDFEIVGREMERGLYYPARWMFRHAFDKAKQGDFAVSGRIAARIAQAQSWLVLAIVVLVLAAVAVTALGVKV